MEIDAYLLTCPERESVLAQTIQNLQATDWQSPVHVVTDQVDYPRRQERQEKTALRLLQLAVENDSEMILFLEDDLQFNRHLRFNLEHWTPLRHYTKGAFFFGSLYNPGISALKCCAQLNFSTAVPFSVYGSQAFVLSRAIAEHVLEHWDEVQGMQDIKISRLAAQRSSLFYHQPSLVQHVGANSVWGGAFHTARDFQADWQTGPKTPAQEAVIESILILDRLRACGGWLDDEEAELLISLTKRAAARIPVGSPAAVVEVSSFPGKSTVVLALVLKGINRFDLRVTSISPHDGRVTTPDGSLLQVEPTLEKFKRDLRLVGAEEWVDLLVAQAAEVSWEKPVALLMIDGLHDDESVAADFNPFVSSIHPGAFVAFHDCGSHFPGVRRFVDRLLSGGEFRLFQQVKSMVVLEKRG